MSIPSFTSRTGWTLLRWGLAAVFLYAGAVKVWDAAPLAASIARFQILPAFLIHPIALGLPPMEVLCGLALIVGPWKRQAAFAVTVLCLIFSVALVSAAVRGITVECSCFGGTVAEPVWRIIARDAVLLLSALATYLHLVRQQLPQLPKSATDIGVLNRPSRCLH